MELHQLIEMLQTYPFPLLWHISNNPYPDCFCQQATSLHSSMFSDISSVKSTQAEYLHQGNWQTLQLRVFLPENAMLTIYQHTTDLALS